MSRVELKNVLKVEDPTGFTYYLGTLTPKEIKQLTFVPVVAKTPFQNDESQSLNEKAGEGGYQRAGDSKRMKKIKEFIQERPSCLIPPVLLCARGKWEFKPVNNTYKNYGTVQAKDLAAIIDGQHRLGGLWQLAIDEESNEILKNREIPFMAIDDLDINEEKREFVDINGNQKGVKKSLLIYLERETDFSSMAALALMEDEESVFRGRISLEKKYDWTIFLFGAAKECVDLMFGKDFVKTKNFNPKEDSERRVEAIEFTLKYWKAVREQMSEFWADMNKMPSLNEKKSKEKPGTSGFDYRLLEETGIRAFSKLGCQLFSTTWMASAQSPSFETISAYLEAMSQKEKVKLILSKPSKKPEVLDLDPSLKSTGKAGVEAIYIYLNEALMQAIQGC